jgi:hypothetical protein
MESHNTGFKAIHFPIMREELFCKQVLPTISILRLLRVGVFLFEGLGLSFHLSVFRINTG